ncbi:MAG: stage sporulation protein [Actinomycetota bacterium]|jgi:stage II sporulation protein D
MRRMLLLAVLACLGAALVPRPAPAAIPVLVVDGRGFGHGVGMAQDGAFWMGKAGASTNQILGHFYPGTAIAKATGSVRVAVLTAPNREAFVSFPNGGQVRDGRSGAQSPGFPVRVGPGGQVRIRFDGSRYTATATAGGQAAAAPSPSPTAQSQAAPAPTAPGGVAVADEPTTTTSTTTPSLFPTTSTTIPLAPATTTTAPPQQPPPTAPEASTTPSSASSLWAVPDDGGTVGVPARSRRYRGVVEATAGGGALRLVDELDVEQYLRGMGEVRNPSWPPASLRAQAVAARTYALRAMSTAGELCDTQRCQVYLGADAEYAAMNKAVADSARQVVVFGRSLASAVYSANGGGFSASREEGFGTTGAGYPYLRPAPYDTKDPLPWQVKVAYADLAARFGYSGQLTGVRVSKAGPSGRALEVTLDGSTGPRTVSGLAFDAGLGLKSTLFTLTAGTADVAPPPPPPGEGLQALPEDLAPSAATAAGATLPDFGDLAGRPDAIKVSSVGNSDATDAPLSVFAVALNVSAAAVVGRRFVRRRA